MRSDKGKTVRVTLVFSRISTEWGDFAAVFSPAGLRGLYWPEEAGAWLAADGADAVLPALARELRRQLAEYISHRRRAFTLPLDLSGSSEFARTVWRQMCLIPYGQRRSYGELAREIGRPGAARAVGCACGANPLPIIQPCHRVVAAGGIGGFSGPEGWKTRLLAHEDC